jgi:2-phospho-L-lactate/phosphoenolpyruvate guanylyltransferase
LIDDMQGTLVTGFAGGPSDGTDPYTARCMAAPPIAVLVPVKDFARAKVRLAEHLDAAARATLARDMAGIVLAAAVPLPVSVVCDDPDVRAWATSVGAEVIWTPGLGLNGAVQAGVDELARRGVTTVVVAHSDLPLATSLAWVAATEGVTIVPDRRLDGTNVLAVPAASGFRFSYGAGSFERHRAEGLRLGLPVRVVRDARLGWDVDHPADLVLPAHY